MESSLFTKVAAVLFVAGLAALTEGCDPSQIAACSAGMQNPGQDVDAMCAAAEKMKQCILKAVEGCPPEVVAQSTKALEQSTAPCNPDSGCSMKKMKKCIEGLPMEAPPNPDEIDLNTMCPKISKAKMCLEKIVNSCDNQDIKSSIQQTVTGMQQYETICNKHSEKYESGSSGNSDNSDVKVTLDESAKEEVEVAIAEAEAEAEKEGEDEGGIFAEPQGKNKQTNSGGGNSGSGNGENGSPSIRASVFALSSLLALPLCVQAFIRM
ncbi:uncharacterized protein LOC101845512 [Aplysia californica]|uniref:Uncharacterized protein LOC101845512 n=1 Tax=Aplysia californica TaxID=6500 RepID=A0ABM0K8N8_APLCA|nr:uncharacterized protein LOC101845512 [Aplysia californica]